MNSARDRMFSELEQQAGSEVVAAEVQHLRERLQNVDERSHDLESTAVRSVEGFCSLAESAGAVVLHADEPKDVPALIDEYLRAAASVVLSEDDLVTSCGLKETLRSRNDGCRVYTVTDAVLQLAAEDWKHVYASADIGITAAVAGVAESGAVVIASSENESRSVSLLPHTHVVLLRERDIVPSLVTSATILRHLITERGASAVTLIDGPSKTADIEKVLVTGVHGPRTFIIVLIGDGSDAASAMNAPL